MDLVADEALSANIDTELLQEVLHVFARRGQSQDGFDLFERLLHLFPDPFPVSRETARLGKEIMTQTQGLSGRDAFHAAIVREYGLEGIISADRGFDTISSIKRFDPLELGKTW